MKYLLNYSKEDALKFLNTCNPESVEYLEEYKDEIDNLTVVESTGYDFVEVDPSDVISDIRYRYISFGIDEDLIDDSKEFDSIYEALCIIENGDEQS